MGEKARIVFFNFMAVLSLTTTVALALYETGCVINELIRSQPPSTIIGMIILVFKHALRFFIMAILLITAKAFQLAANTPKAQAKT
jgi:hypothetical protein